MQLEKIVAALALAGLTLGCSSDNCQSACEKAQKCPDATPAQKAEDCSKQCDTAQQAVDKANCAGQFDSYSSCESDLNDICTAPANACGTQQNALVSCMGPYCLKNPSDATCQLYLGSSD